MNVKAYGLIEDGKMVWYRAEDDTKIEPCLFDVSCDGSCETEKALDQLEVAVAETVRPFVVWADLDEEWWTYIGSAWAWQEAVSWAKAMSVGASVWTRVTSLESVG